jgi:POT family proton-dependent oligopeptide transporter
MPLVGASIADTYLGRYTTIMYAILISLVGHILLVISGTHPPSPLLCQAQPLHLAIPPVIVNPKGALACLIIAMIVMGMGTGGFKSNISPLIAEQQQCLKPFVRVAKNGERVIVDPAMTTARIYMWFYFFINVGALVGPIGMTYGEKVRFFSMLRPSTSGS